MRTGITVIITIAVIGICAFLYAWNGLYNIAATESHRNITARFLDMTKNHSIAARSGDIETPDLDDPEKRRHALPHYHGMCRYCHGAPGYPPSEFAGGLNPSPPQMISGRIQEHWNDAELYWIVKNGIKFTGMPAFGNGHSEDELWGIAALSRRIPRMTPEQYRRALEQTSIKQDKQDSAHPHPEDGNTNSGGKDREKPPEKEDHSGHSH
ncbi:MAG: c-type cytochrome [Thermodesulfobacteriota bacterium]